MFVVEVGGIVWWLLLPASAANSMAVKLWFLSLHLAASARISRLFAEPMILMLIYMVTEGHGNP